MIAALKEPGDWLAQVRRLSRTQRALLRKAQILHPEDLYSLLTTFPSLSELGFNLRSLSSAALRASPAGYRASFAGVAPPPGGAQGAFGALYPAGAPAQPGFAVPMPFPSPAIRNSLLTGRTEEPPPLALDLRPTSTPWPVRDQGLRGTCVAFALAACREHLAFEAGENPATFDLSEQFLFWAAKRRPNDPSPQEDGTCLELAKEALEHSGICREKRCLYDPRVHPGNVTQAAPGHPSFAAIAEALRFAVVASHYHLGATAHLVKNALQESGRPVALTLPVFSDRLLPESNNWESRSARLYGKVLDPPPTAIVNRGHAVCVTGFAEDPSEALGGHFIFRNSWGVQRFGSQLPTVGYFGPEPGYGQISASYVDLYLWEMCQL